MSTSVSPELLVAQLELADQLRDGRDRMLEPQDLPGRYGRVIHALDRLLAAKPRAKPWWQVAGPSP